MILARIYETQDNLAGASEQYRLAIVNEPQRPELRFSFASSLTRQRRYDEAIAALKEGWIFAGHDPQWLIEVARIQVLQGKRDDAVQTMRQVLAAKPSAQDHLAVAAQLAAWGLDSEAVKVYDDVFAGLPKTLKREGAQPGDVAGYVRALVRTTPVASAFQKMERTRATFSAIAQNSKDTDQYSAGSIVNAIDASMRAGFGQGVIDYASPAETSDLESAVRQATAGLTAYSDKDQLLRYLGIARGAGLVEEEEQIHVQIKDAAFKVRTKPEDSAFYNELRELLVFYDRRLAFTRAAEVLVTEYARDPFKDHFDYNNQIATQYRLAGDRDRELDSLRRAYAAESGSGITANSDWVGRYLDLVYSSGGHDELTRLASSYNPHQLQLINFLIEKNEKDLARAAIRSAMQSPAWVASRNAEIGLFAKDFSAETEQYFKAALGPRTIGEMRGEKVDSSKTLLGDDWGIGARDYGYWLGLQPARRASARQFLAGEIERHPTSAGPQLELAGFYLEQRDPAPAADHTALAEELAPKDKNVAAMRGAIALARGDRQGALDAWRPIITGGSVADAQLYLKLTAGHGLLTEALPYLREFVVTGINHASPEKASNTVEAMKPLLREIAAASQDDPVLARQEAGFFQNVVERIPLDLTIPRMVVEEKLLPDSALAYFYRTVHQRLTDAAASVVGTPAYEAGYNNGLENVVPARDLSDWRRRLLDYLIRNASFAEARLLVTTIQKEQADLQVTAKPRDTDDDSTDTGYVDHYDWLPLAAALIELRGGGDPAAVVSDLRKYCMLKEKTGSDDSEAPPAEAHLNPHCLKAYALLVAEHRDTDADALLYDAYREVVRSRHADDTSIAALAEIEARRGQTDDALKLLKKLVQRSTDNLGALRLAAETAARIGSYAEAIDFRHQIALANPADSTNVLELSRVIHAAGRNGEALDRLIALIGERITPNTVRAQAAEIIGEIAGADKSQGTRAAGLLDQPASAGDAGAALARAAIAEALGNKDEERSTLSRVNVGSLAAVAKLKLGVLSLAVKDDHGALVAFEQTVYLDPEGTMTGAVSFRVPGPRLPLIELYTKLGRDLTAVQLAEDRGSGVSAAVLAALTTGRPQEEEPDNRSGSTTQAGPVLFEPPLNTSRLRGPGPRTIDELQVAAASETHGDLLAALAEATSRLGQYDKAIAIERLRAVQAERLDEKTAIEKVLSQMLAAEKARLVRAAVLLRIDGSNTIQSLYASRAAGG
jgi:Tfp pilus assembly protein PilF